MSLCPGRPQRTELRSHPWGMNNPGTREWIALGLRGFLKIREPIFPSSRYMVCWSQHHPIRHSQLMQASVVQLLSHVWLFATPWIAASQASLSITISRSSLRLTSIESVMPSSHLILCRALLPLPPIPPSIRVFSIESTLHMRRPKYWSFSFSISPSKELPGLISFKN